MEPEQLSLFKLIKFNKTPNHEIPENIVLKKNEIWCPYCSNIVIMKKDKYLGVKKCPICGITENDYWVRKINRIR